MQLARSASSMTRVGRPTRGTCSRLDLAIDLPGDLVTDPDDVVDLRERRGFLAEALQVAAERLDDAQVGRLEALQALEAVLAAIGAGPEQGPPGVDDRAP